MRRAVILVSGILSLFASMITPAGAGLEGLQSWDWAHAASPGTHARLLDVLKVGGEIWAVGNARPDPLVVRGNGSSLARVSIPALANRDDVLEGIDGIAANDIWASDTPTTSTRSARSRGHTIGTAHHGLGSRHRTQAIPDRAMISSR